MADVDLIIHRMKSVKIEQKDELVHEVAVEIAAAEEPGYLHIDLRDTGTSKAGRATNQFLGRRINSYMLRKGCYDPRRLRNFIGDLLDEKKETLATVSLKQLREIASMGDAYYELWRVPAAFDLKALFVHLREGQVERKLNNQNGLYHAAVIQVCHIQNNEDELYTVNLP